MSTRRIDFCFISWMFLLSVSVGASDEARPNRRTEPVEAVYPEQRQVLLQDARYLDYDNLPNPSTTGPAPTANRLVVARNCANCHSQVHGSNHPSGPLLQR